MLNTSQSSFLALAKTYESLKKQMKELRSQLDAAAGDLGVDEMFQDPDTGAVYKIVEPTGTFIEFRKIDYKRTALEGERGGTVLSKSEAEEAGFKLPGKK